jgi:hypothetical protein
MLEESTAFAVLAGLLDGVTGLALSFLLAIAAGDLLREFGHEIPQRSPTAIATSLLS